MRIRGVFSILAVAWLAGCANHALPPISSSTASGVKVITLVAGQDVPRLPVFSKFPARFEWPGNENLTDLGNQHLSTSHVFVLAGEQTPSYRRFLAEDGHLISGALNYDYRPESYDAEKAVAGGVATGATLKAAYDMGHLNLGFFLVERASRSRGDQTRLVRASMLKDIPPDPVMALPTIVTASGGGVQAIRIEIVSVAYGEASLEELRNATFEEGVLRVMRLK